GEIVNLGKNITNSVEVSGVFFDSNHKVIDVVKTFPKSTELNPDQRTSFDLVIWSPNVKAIKFASINAQSKEYSSIKYGSHQLIDLTQQEQPQARIGSLDSTSVTSSHIPNNNN